MFYPNKLLVIAVLLLICIYSTAYADSIQGEIGGSKSDSDGLIAQEGLSTEAKIEQIVRSHLSMNIYLNTVTRGFDHVSSFTRGYGYTLLLEPGRYELVQTREVSSRTSCIQSSGKRFTALIKYFMAQIKTDSQQYFWVLIRSERSSDTCGRSKIG